MNETLRISDAQKDYLRTEKICTRTAAMRKVIDEGSMTARTVAATETPAVVIDWERWEAVREILLITPESVMIPESRQLPLLDSHSRREVANIKGSIRDLQVEGNELVGVSHFAENAKQEFSLVRDGHLTDVSVGYRTFPEHTVIIPKGEKAVIGGREFVNDYEDGLTMLVRTQWEPKEVSLVAIGADSAAKFRDEPKDNAVIDALGTMGRKIEEVENKIKIITKGETPMDEKVNVQDIRKAERERIAAIEGFAERFAGKVPKLKETASEMIANGKTAEEFRNFILDNIDMSQPVETPNSEIGMSGKEIKDFSITRAILAAASGNWQGAELEREAIQAVAERTDKTFSGSNILLPREIQNFSARTLTAGAGGASVVGTDLRGDEFIEYLRNRLVLAKAGMRSLSGLQGNIALPKQSAGATITAIAEGTAQTPSDPTFTQVSGSPNTVSGQTKYSRKLLIQSNPSVDALVYQDLFAQLAVKVDYYGLHGTGVAPEPTGIDSTSGVGSVSMLTVDWAHIVAFETAIATANAEIESMKWITNAAVKGKLKTTLKANNTAEFLMNDKNIANGYPALITQNVKSQNLFFGDWSQLIFAEWGAAELIVDPYTEAGSGLIAVTIQDEIDFLVRQASAFALATDVAV